MNRIGLQSLLFLMIFGPKFDGWLDILSLTSAIVFLYCICQFRLSSIPLAARQGSLIVLCAVAALFTFACCHYLLGIDPEPYQTLRFGRVILNFGGVFALVLVYHERFGRSARTFLAHDVFHCLVVHAVIMLLMFLSPGFRDFVVNHMVAVDPESRSYVAKVSGYRIAGLTDSWDALSGIESLGLLMLPILLTRGRPISYTYAACSAPLLIFAVAISGRTGFVTLALLLPVALYFTDLRRLHRGVVAAGLVVGIAAACWNLFGHTEVLDSVRESSIMRSLSVLGVEDHARRHESLGDTFAAIREHYFLPEKWSTFFLGTGGSGRATGSYVAADNGLVLNLHNLGIICWVLMYGLLAGMVLRGLACRRQDAATAGYCVLAVLIVLSVDAKVAYVYARNGFTVMMVLGMLPWWHSGESRSSTLVPAALRVHTKPYRWLSRPALANRRIHGTTLDRNVQWKRPS